MRILWNLFQYTKNENSKPENTSAATFITIQANHLTKVTKILAFIRFQNKIRCAIIAPNPTLLMA